MLLDFRQLSFYEDIVAEAVYKYGAKHPWLKRIIKQDCVRYINRSHDQLTDQDIGYVPVYDFSWKEDLSSTTKSCLEALNPVEQILVESAIINENDTNTISKETNISTKSVRRIINKALVKLKKCLTCKI